MGSIKRFDLGRIIKDFETSYFFETGTFLGDGVAHALGFPFEAIISVEIIPGIAQQAKKRFAHHSHINIIEADSVSGLEQQLPQLKKNIVFWLDAHFPGADAGLSSYGEAGSEDLRLPLKKEIETICRTRTGFNDVFILDDLRIYEDGDFENGNVPGDALPSSARNVDFIYECFGSSHFIFKSYFDEGYILLFPRKKYKRSHFKFMDLFRSPAYKEDHYNNCEL